MFSSFAFCPKGIQTYALGWTMTMTMTGWSLKTQVAMGMPNTAFILKINPII